MTLRYSSDRAEIVKEARKKGMTDAEILDAVCKSETKVNRRKFVKQWAIELGLSESEALDVAKKSGLL